MRSSPPTSENLGGSPGMRTPTTQAQLPTPTSQNLGGSPSMRPPTSQALGGSPGTRQTSSSSLSSLHHQPSLPFIITGTETNPGAPVVIQSEVGTQMSEEGLSDITEGDEEQPQDLLAPNADVYSYFLLAQPMEHKKHARFTVDALTSYVLVMVVVFIQCILLFCVWNEVIVANFNWRDGIMNTGKDWNLVGQTQRCNDGSSLCTKHNGTFTCAPPSVQLISRWDELDLNEDGVWTRSEVLSNRETLQCKYAVDPLEVFDMLTRILMDRELASYISLSEDVKSGKAINRDYFTYVKGDVAMCGYRNEDMCGNLVKRGVFDAALMSGNIPRVGKTIGSALEYCHELLDHGGLCDRHLPSAYATWKIESVQECGASDFSKFVYEDPKTGRVKSLLKVDYEARKNYERAKTPLFFVYKACIIFIWLLLIANQLKDVVRTLAWIKSVPYTDHDDVEAESPSAREKRLSRMDSARRRLEEQQEECHQLTHGHRFMLYMISYIRIGVIIVLLYVGMNFLARSNDYIGLLLDGVALVFILEVAEIVYATTIRRDVRQAWEEKAPVPFTTQGFGNGRPDVWDLVWFVGIAAVAILFLAYWTKSTVNPLSHALECACLNKGDECHEAHTFSYDFWQQYWALDLPSSIMRIHQEHGRSGARPPIRYAQPHAHGASLLQSSGEHVARLAGNLLQRQHHLQASP